MKRVTLWMILVFVGIGATGAVIAAAFAASGGTERLGPGIEIQAPATTAPAIPSVTADPALDPAASPTDSGAGSAGGSGSGGSDDGSTGTGTGSVGGGSMGSGSGAAEPVQPAAPVPLGGDDDDDDDADDIEDSDGDDDGED